MKRAYAAIGKAVIFAQILEATIVPLSEIFKMKSDPAYFEKTGGFISEGAFKNATTNIIKELEKRAGIDAGRQERLSDRHRALHEEFAWSRRKAVEGTARIDRFTYCEDDA
jgi:hypothetical protein